MNGWMKSTVGVTLAGLIVLFATYGKQFVESLHALWLFSLEMSRDAPLGLASFVVALLLATVARRFLRKWVPHIALFQVSRDFLVDAATLAIGVTVTMVQMSGSPQARLSALWLGLAAGLLAPLVYNGIAAVFAMTARQMQASPKCPDHDEENRK